MSLKPEVSSVVRFNIATPGYEMKMRSRNNKCRSFTDLACVLVFDPRLLLAYYDCKIKQLPCHDLFAVGNYSADYTEVVLHSYETAMMYMYVMYVYVRMRKGVGYIFWMLGGSNEDRAHAYLDLFNAALE